MRSNIYFLVHLQIWNCVCGWMNSAGTYIMLIKISRYYSFPHLLDFFRIWRKWEHEMLDKERSKLV